MDNEHSERKSGTMTQLPIAQLVPGMVIARDIFLDNKQLIVAKGVTLQSSMIAKLMYYHIRYVYVYQTEIHNQEKNEYYREIRESVQFVSFQKNYQSVLAELRQYLNKVIEHTIVLNQDVLVNKIKKIMDIEKGKYHLFELIYNIYEHDDMTLAHSINVALICNTFGQWLNMSEEDISVLTVCGLMHDIGKVKVPRNILRKPGTLTEAEKEIIRRHPKDGFEMMLDYGMDDRIRLAILQHHERYDGSGYPFQKTGEAIHPFSMITAIADVFDAMTSNRVYRNAICPFKALDFFEYQAKREFDIRYSLPLIERIAQIYINRTVLLNDERQGEIIMLNRDALSRPVIKSGNEFIDLSKSREFSIKSMA